VCYFLIIYSFCINKNPVTAGLCSQYYKETMHPHSVNPLI
jgi:hypothetical protein